MIEKFFKHPLFLVGLHDNLRMKVMEAVKDSQHKSMRFAQEFEIIHHIKHHDQAVATGTELLLAEEDKLSDKELKAYTAICFCQGEPPFKQPSDQSTFAICKENSEYHSVDADKFNKIAE